MAKLAPGRLPCVRGGSPRECAAIADALNTSDMPAHAAAWGMESA